MNNKTLYVSDLDGTLLNKDAALSAYTKNALNRLISSGVHFTIATGRTTDAAKVIMAGVDLNVPVISFNGAIISNVTEESSIKVYRLSAGAIKETIAALRAHGVSGLMYVYENNGLIAYYESLKQKHIINFIEERKSRYHSVFRQVEDLNAISPAHVMYFTIVDARSRIQPVYDAMQKTPGIEMTLIQDTYHDDTWFMEVYSGGASKQSAVSYLREVYGYDEIIGFGDNVNDLPMFDACDVCVAVDNGVEEVKAAAGYICESHERDGVVKWIEARTGNDEDKLRP